MRKPINHGTYGGYQTHHKQGVPMCAPCMNASAEYQRNRRHHSVALRLSDLNQTRAYDRALRRLRDTHRKEFDRYYREERGY